MSKFLYMVLLIAAVGGGWYVYKNYEITGLDAVGLQSRGAKPQGGVSSVPPKRTKTPPKAEKTPSDGPRANSIRVATFNFGPLDHHKLGNRNVTNHLVQVVQRFDLLAVQNIQAPNQGLLVALLEQVNAQGRQYDFAVSAEVGRGPVDLYNAFLFDRATVQIDRSTVYQVEDRTGLLRRPPLVGSFQVQGPEPAEAFTFTLINVYNDANRAAGELDALDDVFRAVRDDGRGEDDIILLGDLATDDMNFGQLGEIPHLTWAVSGTPSTLRASRLVDNVLFDRRATTEFTGRSGVMDLMRDFDLPMREVLEISEHFPVWAEFTAYEGGQAGHVAADPRTTTLSGGR